ncbi:hypothetical protein HK105_205123 [Polyrhizophydium stewartii]|uniref:Uncharacterized protein n=1 Tax=Polyrhizophydium stewartii TaxID=2732419 RepID=A0ABR4N6S9_9FUNG
MDIFTSTMDVMLLARLAIMRNRAQQTGRTSVVGQIKMIYFYKAVACMLVLISIPIIMTALYTSGNDSGWQFYVVLFLFRITLTDMFSNAMRDSLIEGRAESAKRQRSTVPSARPSTVQMAGTKSFSARFGSIGCRHLAQLLPIGDTSLEMRVLTAVRIHRNNQQDKSLPIDLDRLRRLVDGSWAYSAAIAIAYPSADTPLGHALSDEFVGDAAAATPAGPDVRLVPVADWGNFVPALNALLLAAAHGSFTHILFQSVEAECSASQVEALSREFGPDVLVVGKALSGHRFVAGVQRLDGVTTPWNTLALWSVSKLALTGFLMVAEGIQVHPGIEGGVEEVSAIAVLQRLLNPAHARAVLVRFSEDSTSWATECKVARPAAHLSMLSLDGFEALVEHKQI